MILFIFLGGAMISMTLYFLCSINLREKVIGYLEMSYAFCKYNGGGWCREWGGEGGEVLVVRGRLFGVAKCWYPHVLFTDF